MSAVNDVEQPAAGQSAGLLTALRRHPVVVIVFLVLGAAVGAGITYLLPTHYTAQARIVLGSENDLYVFRSVPNLNATAKAQNAAQIMRSDAVYARASKILDGKLSPNQVKKAVTVAPGQEGNPLVTATATRNSARAAKDVANAEGQAYLEVTRTQAASRGARQKSTLEASQSSAQQQLTSLNDQISHRSDELRATTPKGLTADERVRFLQSAQADDLQYQSLTGQAAQATTTLDSIKRQLQETTIDAKLAGGGADTLFRAGTPSDPQHSNLVRNVGIAAVIGLLIGAAFAWRRLDGERAVVDHVQVANALGAPLLARFTRTRELSSPGTVVDLSPGRPLADDLRVVAASLMLHLRHHDLSAAVITSAEPREGKTVLAVNLAAAADSAGHDVILVDGDVRHATLSSAFGLDRAPGLHELVGGVADQAQVNHEIEHQSGSLSVIPVGQQASGAATHAGLPALTGTDGRPAVAVVDSPALSEDPATLWLAARAAGLVVVVSGAARMDALRTLRARADVAGAPIIGFIVNDRRRSGFDRLRRDPLHARRRRHSRVAAAAPAAAFSR